jgi:transposase InsO family protein
MSFHRESPLRPTGGPGRAARLDEAARLSAESERARRRYLISGIVAAFGADASPREQIEAVQKAINVGVLDVAAVPSSRTIRRWLAKRAARPNSIDSFKEEPRCGRTRLHIDARLGKIIEDAVRTQRPKSIRRVHKTVKEAAALHGLHAPSYGTVYAFYKALGTLLASAARHGKEAAEIDGLPHSTVPAPFTHDVWTLDELVLPVWTRLYNPVTKGWNSFRPTVVVIYDNCSRVIVGYWVCDPDRRFTRTEPGLHMGADKTDVLATLVGAACPQVAPSACRAYSGYLPQTLRWDRAWAHRALAEGLVGLNIEVPDLPGNRPINRGLGERGIGTIKPMCDSILGYNQEYSPSDRPGPAVEDDQEVAAGTDSRVKTKTFIDPEYLYSIDEIRPLFDAVVRQYNELHEHRGIEMQCPGDVYRKQLRRPRERRRGADIRLLLDPKVVKVAREGVVHWEGPRSYRFATAAGVLALTLGAPVSYRADPMLRGLFAEADGHPLFLKPLSVWAAEQNPAHVAKDQKAAAGRAFVDANRVRRLADAQAIGLAALEQAESAQLAAAAMAGGTAPGPGMDFGNGNGFTDGPGSPSSASPADDDLAGVGPLFTASTPTTKAADATNTTTPTASPDAAALTTPSSTDREGGHE